ncbi:ABC transporter permease [Kibdelosporangium phytohabitans]|uniref:Transport permease protein n=1 Tax=Kibdelosporangium phytohabitans TaxID=860235 RepID=A0A0N9I3G0_9PSEU|nr:ABC transporter permease [Kibdelosporangium phytohabitans]ALG09299.1 ABC transporter permease [Kibdelosporangium phytohabitans]MBE1469449.1 ABC-2 type transport system permease protein [Kibdelosporangium phytohabitans]
MTSLPHALNDSGIMLGRNLRHTLRNPTTLFGSLLVPIILILVFVYILGGAFSAGGRYVDYIAPGGLVLTMGYGVASTAIGVANDMAEGIIARFRTMAISRAAVLTGHVAGSVIRTVACVALVIGVLLLMGFSPDAGVAAWLAVAGLVVLMAFATAWLTVAFGLAAKTVEGASFATFPMVFLPFISSAFAPTGSMPAGVRWFTDNQPFTPIIETLRGLLIGTPIGDNGMLAVIWCLVMALGGYLWARAVINRDPAG